jgi:uncharacterized membrane protein (UPF0182 family)
MSQRRLILAIALLFFLATILFPTLTGLLIDWWWFQEIGYQPVFTRPLLTSLLLFLTVGGVTFLVLYGNLRLAQRGLVPYPVVLRFAQNQPRVDRFPVGGIRCNPGMGSRAAADLCLPV